MGLALGCLQVEQSTVAIKEVFGKYDDMLEPGFHCVPWLFCTQIAGYLSLRVQQLDVHCETKTKVSSQLPNCVNTTVNFISFRRCLVLEFNGNVSAMTMFLSLLLHLFNIEGWQKRQLMPFTSLAIRGNVIRACVPKMDLDSSFEEKKEIARAVEEELEKTLIVDIEPDERVKRAMNEINSAFSENVPGTSSKDVMDMVLVTQYFDTLKEIGASSKSNSVFVPHGPGAVRDIASQCRDGLLQSMGRS
ncbi:hypothetical protein VNO80_25057 [Phaseolus coccineus]|uniref:Band 7 domain-containing protein n=1 Tax=Phaseolus coccineus TaxID=3886 RepID=A0AAN9LX40_PHACN